MTKTPKKFVNLHSHSHFSIGDAIGSPQEHIDFALANGADALALTDHGNMNGYASQYTHAEKLKKSGVNFKALAGIEAYFVPSLKEWRSLKTASDNAKAVERENKKAVKDKNDGLDPTIGDELAATKEELAQLAGGNTSDSPEDESAGTVIENESESKSNDKFRDPLKRRNHLVLLPKNSEGLKALFRIVSASYVDGFFMYPRIDFDILKKEAKGNIVATTACIAGPDSYIIAKHQTEPDWNNWGPNDTNKELIQAELIDLIKQFKDALGAENFYLEMQFNKLGAQHLKNYHIIEAAKRTNTKLVVTCDAHYSNPDHWRERELYKAMAWASKSKGHVDNEKIPRVIGDLKCELYPKNADQIWETYKETSKVYPGVYDDTLVAEAIERTWSIAHEQIGNVVPDRSIKLSVIEKLVPKSHLDELVAKLGPGADEDALAFEELKTLAKEGIRNKKKEKSQKYVDRLLHELSVIKELKFAKYFLTYSKIMEVVGKHMMTGVARGSAGGSLLAYVLGITQIDPIRFDLLFERFLVRKKKGWPDIDTDFGDREKATKLIADYFGEENVVSVSNFNQLQLRSLIKDVARAAGVPFDEINKCTSKIEAETLAEAKKIPGFDRQVWVLTYEEAEQSSQSFRELMTKYPEFERIVKILFKQMRNVSRHASGLIITNNPREAMPMIKSGDVFQTPWVEGLNARYLEDFGLLKFDILGLGTLRMFEECVRKIVKKQMKSKYVTFDMVQKWFNDNLHPDNNKLDDQEVFKHVYWDNHYAGVFQFINPQVQKFMAEMKPKNITDIAIATSIFRPGPLAAGVDKMYLQNRKSPSGVRFKHPMLEDVLKDTSGLLVFQEQLQLIYHKLAGVPLEDTDAVRKAFTKKNISNRDLAEKERLEMREDFADKCLSANDIPRQTSYDIFDEMQRLVAYSFNKSHAMAYAITSYQCAWLLTYYPDEWITTYIDYCSTEKGKQSGKEDPKAVALGEAKGLGYAVGKPDINLSERTYTIQNKKLVPSFASLKHVGLSVLGEIIENRPYKTVEDLLFTSGSNPSWRHSKFNKRALGTLVKLEGLDSMGLVGEGKQFANYRQLYYVLVDKGDDLKRAVTKKKKTHKEDLERYIQEAKLLPDWTLQEKVEFSVELAGSVDIDLIVTPDIAEYFQKKDIPSIDDREHDDQWVWCVAKTCTANKTKTGKFYMKMQVYGLSGATMPVFCWNYNPITDTLIPANSLIIGRFKKTDFGLSTFFRGLEIITQK